MLCTFKCENVHLTKYIPYNCNKQTDVKTCLMIYRLIYLGMNGVLGGEMRRNQRASMELMKGFGMMLALCIPGHLLYQKVFDLTIFLFY